MAFFIFVYIFVISTYTLSLSFYSFFQLLSDYISTCKRLNQYQIAWNEDTTMKILATSLIAATLFASTNVSADSHFIAANDSPATALCMAFASNKPLKMKKSLDHYNLHKNQIKKLSCNQLSLKDFSSRYGLTRTGNYLNLEVRTSTSIRDLAMNASAPMMITGS